MLLIISGCDQNEINDLAIITGFGVDLVEEAGEINLSVQIINPKAFGVDGKGKPIEVVSIHGLNIPDAFRNLSMKLSKKAFLAQNSVIIISKDIAKKGIASIIDYFERYVDIRLTDYIIIADESAVEILNSKIPIEDVSMYGIDNIIKIFNEKSYAPTINLKDLLINLKTPNIATLIPVFTVKGGNIEYHGAAILQKDKLVDIIPPAYARGVNWLKSNLKGGNISIPCPNNNKNYLSFEIKNSSYKIEPHIKNDKLSLNIKIEATTVLIDLPCTIDLKKPDSMDKINALQKEDIRKRLSSLIKHTKKERTDIFGFYNYFRIKYPKVIKKYEKDWKNIYANIPITLDIKVNTSTIGESFNSLKVK